MRRRPVGVGVGALGKARAPAHLSLRLRLLTFLLRLRNLMTHVTCAAMATALKQCVLPYPPCLSAPLHPSVFLPLVSRVPRPPL